MGRLASFFWFFVADILFAVGLVILEGIMVGSPKPQTMAPVTDVSFADCVVVSDDPWAIEHLSALGFVPCDESPDTLATAAVDRGPRVLY